MLEHPPPQILGEEVRRISWWSYDTSSKSLLHPLPALDSELERHSTICKGKELTRNEKLVSSNSMSHVFVTSFQIGRRMYRSNSGGQLSGSNSSLPCASYQRQGRAALTRAFLELAGSPTARKNLSGSFTVPAGGTVVRE